MSAAQGFSAVDRLLHRIAFATWPIQAALGDVEQVMFRSELEHVAIDQPVFIAGLPRAGTTVLLEMIEATGGFASYHYRDMPFLLTPMLWRQFGGAARKVEQRERAHGDGMWIDLDSPEALDEVVWRTAEPRHYRPDRITPSTESFSSETAELVRSQMRKVIALRSAERPGARRYLSKNNGGIARLPLLRALFPDAVLVIPFRDPLQHASSLLHQHRRFTAMHAGDRFTRRYMEAIGHYDFGQNLRPIDFGGWLDRGRPDFDTLDGWLRYWCAAYAALLEQRSLGLHFLSYDALCRRPVEVLAALEAVLAVQEGGLRAQADRIDDKAPRIPPQADPGLVAEAQGIASALERLGP